MRRFLNLIVLFLSTPAFASQVGYGTNAGQTCQSMEMTFRVPSAVYYPLPIGGSAQSLTIWLGSGNAAGSPNLAQLVIQIDIGNAGTFMYGYFFQYPTLVTQNSPYSYTPGDIVTISMTCTLNCVANNSATEWTVSIVDQTSGSNWTMNNVVGASANNTCAFIVENPSIGGPSGPFDPVPLFGNINIISAKLNGSAVDFTSGYGFTGSFTDPNGVVVTASSPPSSNHSAFSVCYNNTSNCVSPGNLDPILGSSRMGRAQ